MNEMQLIRGFYLGNLFHDHVIELHVFTDGMNAPTMARALDVGR